MNRELKDKKDSTYALHAGHVRGETPRPKVLPIYQTSVFTFDDVDDCESYYTNEPEGRYVYSRNKNPNHTALEQIIAKLEDGEEAVVTASGMAAIMSLIYSQVQAGDHILASDSLYGGTHVLLDQELRRFGVETTFIDMSNPNSLQAHIYPNTRLLIIETI